MVCLKWDIEKHKTRLTDQPYELWYQLVDDAAWTLIPVNDIFYTHPGELELPGERSAFFQPGKKYRFKLTAFFKDSNDKLHGFTEVTLAGKHKI